MKYEDLWTAEISVEIVRAYSPDMIGLILHSEGVFCASAVALKSVELV